MWDWKKKVQACASFYYSIDPLNLSDFILSSMVDSSMVDSMVDFIVRLI